MRAALATALACLAASALADETDPVGAPIEVPVPTAELAIDPGSGLVLADGFTTVRAVCTGCHSAKLVTQNRATREGWLGMIRWMQRTQKLPELARPVEAQILDYLEAHYAPEPPRQRRAPLDAALLPPPARAATP